MLRDPNRDSQPVWQRVAGAQHIREQEKRPVASIASEWQAVGAAYTLQSGDRALMTPFPESIRRVANADGGVVLDLRRGAMFRVNPVGARVLDLLDEGDSATQIAEKLSAEFNVALHEVLADVQEFIESLKLRGVVGSQ